MRERPLVSVVVPCYQAGRVLGRTVESILHQTYSPIELILVDDGSEDDTAAIMRSFSADPRVLCVFQQNRGASAARTRGQEAASGSFIQFLDADDLLRPRAIEAKLDALIGASAGVAYSDWQRWREDLFGGFRAGDVVTPNPGEMEIDPELATFRSFWVPPAALLYRRTIVDRIGRWHPRLPIIQDARFLQDAAFHGAKFVHVAEVLADYREHRTGSLSKRSKHAFGRDVLCNAMEIEERWRVRAGGLTPDQAEALAATYRHCAASFFDCDHGLFLVAAERLEALGCMDHDTERLRLSCQRWGYAGVRAARAPGRYARGVVSQVVRGVRDIGRAWRDRALRVQTLP